jgi:preprotein translocase subunit SecE
VAARSVNDATSRRLGTPSILSFFQESRAELRKVTWPTRQEAMNLTVAVVGMTAGIAVFLGIIDQILNYIVNPLLGTK